MARVDNKVEILRALERTEEQFDALVERNCKGQLQDPITVVTPSLGIGGGSGGGIDTSVQPTVQGRTFSKEDKEFLEAFKKIYQLGLFQLESFITKLMTGSNMLDEYSILYYIQQLYNGPYAKYAKKFANFQGIFQLCPDVLGIISTVSRSNTSTPVFGGIAVNASAAIYDKCPSFMQRELDIIVQATTDVFNYNFQSSIFDDNTLPYIDKQPGLRIAQELATGFTYGAVGNYMLKDVKAFNVIRDVSQRIIDIVRAFLGSDAFRLLEFKKNINYFNAEQNVSSTSGSGISRLLVFMDQVISDTGDAQLKEKCIELKTGLTGNVLVDDTTTISVDGANLHTVIGMGGTGGSVPITTGGPTPGGPTTATTPLTSEEAPVAPTKEDLCPTKCDDTGFENIKHQ